MSCSRCKRNARRVGDHAREEMSQREVAKAMGISRSRVWQIEKEALRKLKLRMRKEDYV